ncbi:MAG TPA: hypothetical protein VKV73_25125 [Chloroflexota bacterium]|nr:hypothetical protein [Chloroflexota bacterium]
MTTLAAGRVGVSTSISSSYERFAGVCGVLTGIVGFAYAVAFVILRSPSLSALCLLLGGLLGTATLVAVYGRVRETDGSFALLALLLGVTGALGAAIHAGYDLSNVLHPPAAVNLDLPSQIDPRGMLTFGIAGLGLWAMAWLILRGGQFPRGLGYLGYVTALLLIVVYLARLIVLDATSPLVLAPAVLAGFIANPGWYVWLGLSLWRNTR